MLLRRFLTKNRKAEAQADQSTLGNDRSPEPPYISNVTTTPSLTLPGRDFVRQPEYSLTDTIGVPASQATTDYSKRTSGSPLQFSFA